MISPLENVTRQREAWERRQAEMLEGRTRKSEPKVRIRFLQNVSTWSKGSTAAVPESQARDLAARGTALLVDEVGGDGLISQAARKLGGCQERVNEARSELGRLREQELVARGQARDLEQRGGLEATTDEAVEGLAEQLAKARARADVLLSAVRGAEERLRTAQGAEEQQAEAVADLQREATDRRERVARWQAGWEEKRAQAELAVADAGRALARAQDELTQVGETPDERIAADLRRIGELTGEDRE